mmetsp:Transcript_39771/g.100243  ORF Transcript_39771/g.100243 Transcript_39771/m.100243 type:complete len:225 (+) Transcript_39771:692-1366(+)
MTSGSSKWDTPSSGLNPRVSVAWALLDVCWVAGRLERPPSVVSADEEDDSSGRDSRVLESLPKNENGLRSCWSRESSFCRFAPGKRASAEEASVGEVLRNVVALPLCCMERSCCAVALVLEVCTVGIDVDEAAGVTGGDEAEVLATGARWSGDERCVAFRKLNGFVDGREPSAGARAPTSTVPEAAEEAVFTLPLLPLRARLPLPSFPVLPALLVPRVALLLLG